MVASLLQPDVWRFEVAPWPERVFGGRYPSRVSPGETEAMPPEYATEVQTVMNALNDMNQQHVEWDCGTAGIGVLISDSLMFERGEPTPSDPHLSQFYGLAIPLLKRGIPVSPVQLENVTLTNYLKGFRTLLLTYCGMKPLSPDVHQALAGWVKQGGVLVVCDDDTDPYNAVREWWNSNGRQLRTPREDLFAQLGLSAAGGRSSPQNRSSVGIRAREDAHPPGEGSNLHVTAVGRGGVIWMRENPAGIAGSGEGDARLVTTVSRAVAHARLKWRETNYLLLRRGPYMLGAGLDESLAGDPKRLSGRFVSLFDPDLRVQRTVTLEPGSRHFLLDLDAVRGHQPQMLASACKALPLRSGANLLSLVVEGVADTPGVLLLRAPKAPRAITLAGQPLQSFIYSPTHQLLWIRFANEARPRELAIEF
jgi:hypothetical protein